MSLNGSVVHDLLQETTAQERSQLDDEAVRLESFLGEEPLPSGVLTPSFDRVAGGTNAT